MTKKELLAEHAECDRQTNRMTEITYKVLHLRRKGCPACAKLRKEEKRAQHAW
jgi:hypothetical protein